MEGVGGLMAKEKFFYLDESSCNPGYYLIRPDFDKLPLLHTEGSYVILPARLCGISYPQYLRMCRDCFDAKILGKNELYPRVLFKKSEKTTLLLKMLNTYAGAVMWEREHPNYKEHEKIVQEKNPVFYSEVKNTNVLN